MSRVFSLLLLIFSLRADAAQPLSIAGEAFPTVFDYVYDTNYIFPGLGGSVWRNITLYLHPSYPDPVGPMTNHYAKSVTGKLWTQSASACLSVYFPNLLSAGTIDCEQGYFTNLWFPKLTNVSGDLLSFDTPNVTSVNFTNLVNIGGKALLNAEGGVRNWDFSQLQTIGSSIQLGEMYLVTNISFPLLKSVGGWIEISADTNHGGAGAITTGIAFPSLEKLGWANFPAANFNLNSQSLTASKVNELMAMLVNLKDMAGNPWAGKADFSGGSNAPPTGQGIVDKATLTNRGAIILTN